MSGIRLATNNAFLDSFKAMGAGTVNPERNTEITRMPLNATARTEHNGKVQQEKDDKDERKKRRRERRRAVAEQKEKFTLGGSGKSAIMAVLIQALLGAILMTILGTAAVRGTLSTILAGFYGSTGGLTWKGMLVLAIAFIIAYVVIKFWIIDG